MGGLTIRPPGLTINAPPDDASPRLGLSEEGGARLVFTDLLAAGVELETKALADVLLDTPLFGAHTTGAFSYERGTPVLTHTGVPRS